MKPEKAEDIEILINKIASANSAYSQGLPFMTDAEYDILWKQLHEIDSSNPILYHTGENNQLPFDQKLHKTQLYGTNKAFNMQDLEPFLQRFGADKIILEPKYDGCAAILYLGKDEYLDKLILEGNGISGRDITHHLNHIHCPFEPRNMESVEIIIPLSNWKDSYGANPRNKSAGLIASHDISSYHNILELVSHNSGELNYIYQYNGKTDELYEILLTLFQKWSTIYPLDGIMLKAFDERKRIITGHSATTYAWSIAWKPPIQTKETVVTNIEWNVSRTGRVIPTIIYEPIKLCGTINKRVTGNNAKWFIDHDIRVGCQVVIGKAGEIIPKIITVQNTRQVDRQPPFHGVSRPSGVTVPTNSKTLLNAVLTSCPICGTTLIWKGVDLICTGQQCIAKLNKSTSYFYGNEGFQVKSIGEVMFFEVLQNDKIRNIIKDSPWAFLDPIAFDIYKEILSIWGKKRTENYITSLNIVNGKKDACNFISALGLPKLAFTNTRKLFYYLKGGNNPNNVSSQARESFIDGFILYQKAILELKNFKINEPPAPPKLIYCITGTLSESRADIITYLNKFNWAYNMTIVKALNFLIVGDKPGKLKTKRAEELNIKIINEKELRETLKNETRNENY